MNNFVFYSPTEFVFGKDTEIQTGTLAKKYNARKAMIVYGGGSIIRSGLLQRIEDSLQQAGVDYVKLGGVQPNPTDPKVYEGIELARKEGVDFMLPVGEALSLTLQKPLRQECPTKVILGFLYRKSQSEEGLKSGCGTYYSRCRQRRFGQYGDYQTGRSAKTKFACTGITTACFCCDESGTDLYSPPTRQLVALPI